LAEGQSSGGAPLGKVFENDLTWWMTSTGKTFLCSIVSSGIIKFNSAQVEESMLGHCMIWLSKLFTLNFILHNYKHCMSVQWYFTVNTNCNYWLFFKYLPPKEQPEFSELFSNLIYQKIASFWRKLIKWEACKGIREKGY